MPTFLQSKAFYNHTWNWLFGINYIKHYSTSLQLRKIFFQSFSCNKKACTSYIYTKNGSTEAWKKSFDEVWVILKSGLSGELRFYICKGMQLSKRGKINWQKAPEN